MINNDSQIFLLLVLPQEIKTLCQEFCFFTIRIKPKLTWHSEPNECVGIGKTEGADGEHSIILLIYHWMLKLESGRHARNSRYEQMPYDLSVPMILHDQRRNKKKTKPKTNKKPQPRHNYIKPKEF